MAEALPDDLCSSLENGKEAGTPLRGIFWTVSPWDMNGCTTFARSKSLFDLSCLGEARVKRVASPCWLANLDRVPLETLSITPPWLLRLSRLRRRRIHQKTRPPIPADKPAKPPTTPPTIAPTCEDVFLLPLPAPAPGLPVVLHVRTFLRGAELSVDFSRVVAVAEALLVVLLETTDDFPVVVTALVREVAFTGRTALLLVEVDMVLLTAVALPEGLRGALAIDFVRCGEATEVRDGVTLAFDEPSMLGTARICSMVSMIPFSDMTSGGCQWSLRYIKRTCITTYHTAWNQ